MNVLLGKNFASAFALLSIFAASALLLSSFLYAMPGINPQSAWAGTFPGPNGQIAYSKGGDVYFKIHVMNADGSGETALTDSPGDEFSASWTSDGSKIAFSKQRSAERFDIMVMNADGSGETVLTNNELGNFQPSWSLDGSKIAFASDRDFTKTISEIYIMNADGSGETRVTNNDANDWFPSWSPDGSKIAFVSNRNNEISHYDIYVMNADGSGQTSLTNVPHNDYDPTWSPDGSKIAFTSDRDGNHELYVMNADGSGQTRLTETEGVTEHEGNPTWSPDGSKIAFTRSPNTYVINPDGSGETLLGNNPGAEYTLDWGTNTSPAGGDRTPPDTVIDSATDSEGNPIENETATTSNSITFEFSSPDSDDVSQFQCILDNAEEEWQDCTSPISYQNLAEGEHTFRVRAIDAAGNADPTPDGYVWTVEEEEPTPTTPAEAIEELITTVEELEDVSQSTKTSLTAPLQQASNILSDDNPNNDESACGSIGAFINQVNAAERRGTLTEQQATDLRTDAEDIRSELDC